MSKGAEMIVAERKRQVEVEGWTQEHDLGHPPGTLAEAGACYAVGRTLYERRKLPSGTVHYLDIWPWSDWDYKPKDRLSDLVRAGALIAAEIDRLLAEKEDKA